MAENEIPRNIWNNHQEKPCARVTPRMKGETRDLAPPMQDLETREWWEIPAPAPQPPRWRLGDIDWDQFRSPSMRRGGGGTPACTPTTTSRPPFTNQ